jgi:hypothetical protein
MRREDRTSPALAASLMREYSLHGWTATTQQAVALVERMRQDIGSIVEARLLRAAGLVAARRKEAVDERAGAYNALPTLLEMTAAYRLTGASSPSGPPVVLGCVQRCDSGLVTMTEPPKRAGGAKYEVVVACECAAGDWRLAHTKINERALLISLVEAERRGYERRWVNAVPQTPWSRALLEDGLAAMRAGEAKRVSDRYRDEDAPRW